jgi:hypothetical protein
MGTQAFEYNTSGTTPLPAGSTTVTATALNTTGTVKYEFFLNDVSVQASSTSPTYAYTPQASFANMPDKIEVQITDNGTTDIKARDMITAQGLKEGSDAITVNLSNEAHTLPVDILGNVDNAGSGTNITVFIGTTQLNYGTGNNEFQVTTSATNVTAGYAGTSNYNVRGYGLVSNFTSPASITFTITAKNAAGVSTTILKTQSLTASQEGATGTDGDGVQFAYLDNNSSSVPSTPTAIGTGGWTASPTGVTISNQYEWVSQRTSTNGTFGSFSTPALFTNYAEDGSSGSDFDFLAQNVAGLATPAVAGLLMGEDVIGFHRIPADNSAGFNAVLSDFASYMDSSGNFYLNGDGTGGSLAWNDAANTLDIKGNITVTNPGQPKSSYKISLANAHWHQAGHTGLFANINQIAARGYTQTIKPTDPDFYQTNGTGLNNIFEPTRNDIDLYVFDHYWVGPSSGERDEILAMFDRGRRCISFADDSCDGTNVSPDGTTWPIVRDSGVSVTTNTYTWATGSYSAVLPTTSPLIQGTNTAINPSTSGDQTIREIKEDMGNSAVCIPLSVDRAGLLNASNTTVNCNAILMLNDYGGRWIHCTNSLAAFADTVEDRFLDILLGRDPNIENYLKNNTKITGNQIRTGAIRSGNFSTTAGSELDLNVGEIVMGGSTAPDFQVTAAGFVSAKALRTIPLTLTSTNSGDYCVSSQTSELTTVTTIYLDGSVNGGVVGTAGDYPDRVFTHIILDLDCRHGISYTGGNVGAIVNIVPPVLTGGASVNIKLEIAGGADVDLCIEDQNDTTAFGYTYASATAAFQGPATP